MDRSWYWKAGFIVCVALLSLYALVPSWTYFKLPTDTRNDPARFAQARPSWAPDRHLNLGLDLQGGIHLVMGVDVDKALRELSVRRGEEIRSELTRVGIQGVESAGDPQTGLITVRSADAGALAKAKSEISKSFPEFFVKSSSSGEFQLTFSEDSRKRQAENAVDQAIKVIRNRVDKWGVSEPSIAKRGDTSILIQLPGFSNPERAKELLGQTAQLELRLVDEKDQSLAQQANLPPSVHLSSESLQGSSMAYLVSADRRALTDALAKLTPPAGRRYVIGEAQDRMAAPGTPPQYRTYTVLLASGMTGDAIVDTNVTYDQRPGEMNRPSVSVHFNHSGADILEKMSGEHIGERMAIILDETVMSAPSFITRIPEGNCLITLGNGAMNQMLKEAQDLVLVLKSGALPAPVRILEERSVGATLGPELVRTGSLAAAIGLLAVLVFMVLYYRFSGFVADVALVLNGLMVLAIMASLDSVLTLPGIAGFVLTLGMAVDANVLINERIREELRAGKTLTAAVNAGYDKVFWTIFDGHVTALVAGVVINWFGSGPVRGFATTLIIGLLASMFTSIVVTRAILEWFVSHGKLNKAVSF